MKDLFNKPTQLMAILFGLISITLLLTPVSYFSETMAARDKDVLAVIMPLVFYFGFYLLYDQRNTKLIYGKLYMDVWVFDWGPFGDSLELPAHLTEPFPHWVACAPDQVQQTVKQVEDGLRKAGNKRFISPELEGLRINVRCRYFRDPAHCNESGEDYIKSLVGLLEGTRVDFFTFISNNENIDPRWLQKYYYEPAYNGSKLSGS